METNSGISIGGSAHVTAGAMAAGDHASAVAETPPATRAPASGPVPASTSAAGQGSSTPAFHRLIVAVDVIASGRGSTGAQVEMRERLYTLVKTSADASGVPWDDSHREDRGDGILLIPPASVSAELLLGPFVDHLRAGLRARNRTASPDTRLRLRVVVHAGFVRMDPNGVAGRPVNHAFRLLDAPQFKAAVEETKSELALITSDYLYQEIIRDAPGLIDPARYLSLNVVNKETTDLAWTHLS